MRQLSLKAATAVGLEVIQLSQPRQQMAHRWAERSCRFKRLIRDGVDEEHQLLSGRKELGHWNWLNSPTRASIEVR